MSATLREKIQSQNKPIIFYELIPPSIKSGPAEIEAYADCAAELLNGLSFKPDAINIPEIRDEVSHNSSIERQDHFEGKIPAEEFAVLLRQRMHMNQDIILNRCTVYESLNHQAAWFKRVLDQHKIDTVVLVGGESSQITYPGPTVIEMSQYIIQQYNDRFLCGGICIQSRRQKDILRDEPARMIKKINNGIDFFTTQIILDVDRMIELIRDYQIACQKAGVKPRRLLLSFCPITSHKNLEFLRWLGVEIPHLIEKKLFEAEIGIGLRSIKVASGILKKILENLDTLAPDVPIGLNIEHISRNNFELTREMISSLGSVYYDFCKHTATPSNRN